MMYKTILIKRYVKYFIRLKDYTDFTSNINKYSQAMGYTN